MLESVKMINLISYALAHEVVEGNNDTHMMGENMMDMMSSMWGAGTSWGWVAFVFFSLFWILVLVALILLIVYLIKRIQK